MYEVLSITEPIAIAEGTIEASPTETTTLIRNERTRKSVLSVMMWRMLKLEFLKIFLDPVVMI